MCGIAGFTGPANPDILEKMSNLLAHRGPDGAGSNYCARHGVSLIHRRLAIIDIEDGAQPMWNSDGSIGVTFNGELYNHRELRHALELEGYSFQTDHSDTEVLIHGYHAWGKDLCHRLNGMFAFCIYDRVRAKLFCARDRFGKKPFYYSSFGDRFAFASELSALLGHPDVPAELDIVSVKKYLAYNFIPAPRSLYRDVRKLPAGCFLEYDLTDSAFVVDRYYQYTVEPDESLVKRSVSDLGEELFHLLKEATRIRLVADRPVGIFLSGGLDSSAVLSCAASHSAASALQTFSLGFEEKTYDESDAARLVAQHFGTDHHSKILDFTTAKEVAREVVGKLDEPMGDSSILPTYLLAKFARERVVVALSGDGGDELFHGYSPFRALRPAAIYQALLPRAARRGVRSLVGLLPTSEGYMSLDFKLKRTLRGLEDGPATWNPSWLSPLEPSEIGELLKEDTKVEDVFDDAIDAWESSSAPDLAGKTSEFYVRFYMQDSILTKVDRASMMVGLEVRSPFLDGAVVDFARKLPTQYQSRFGQGKRVLRQALKNRVPEEILSQPKKGFGVPLTSWLKEWPAPETSDALAYDEDWLRNTRKAHMTGRRDERLFLWSWFVLQRHLETHDRGSMNG
jgi:asparagine synthase (glutamine-hydrolysing)